MPYFSSLIFVKISWQKQHLPEKVKEPNGFYIFFAQLNCGGLWEKDFSCHPIFLIDYLIKNFLCILPLKKKMANLEC
jgi:hypothetical protein